MKKPLRIAIAVVVVVVALTLAAWFALPAAIASGAKAEAARQGYDLRVARIELTSNSATFVELSLTSMRDPSLVLTAPKVTVDFDGPFLRRERVVVRDGAGVLLGVGMPPDNVAFRALHGAIGAEAVGRPFGSAVTLDLEVTPRFGGATLGPWPATLRRSGGQDVVQVELKPTAPGTAFVRREARGDGSRLQVRIKNARFDELKLAPLALVPHDATVDVEIDQDEAGEKGHGQAKLIASRFVVPGAPGDAPLSLTVAYDLDSKIARVREGSFGFGPFRGSVTGEVERTALPHAKLELTSTRTACSALARTAAEEAFPGLGAMVASMAGDVLRGDLGFVANVDLDVANPSGARMAVRPIGACSIDIPLFPKGFLPPK